MKRAVVVLSAALFCTILLLGWNVFSEMRMNYMLDEAVKNMKIPEYNAYSSYDSIEELKKAWPTISVEESEDISARYAMEVGTGYLEYSFNLNLFEKLFKTKYKLEESKDGKYFIVTMLLKGSTDIDAAIDKKTGGVLHVWSGE